MAKLYVSIRDLDDPDGRPIVASTDQAVVEGVGRLIADRLRQRVVEKLGPAGAEILDLARTRRPREEREK
jgi:hypothetical protein